MSGRPPLVPPPPNLFAAVGLADLVRLRSAMSAAEVAALAKAAGFVLREADLAGHKPEGEVAAKQPPGAGQEN